MTKIVVVMIVISKTETETKTKRADIVITIARCHFRGIRLVKISTRDADAMPVSVWRGVGTLSFLRIDSAGPVVLVFALRGRIISTPSTRGGPLYTFVQAVNGGHLMCICVCVGGG